MFENTIGTQLGALSGSIPKPSKITNMQDDHRGNSGTQSTPCLSQLLYNCFVLFVTYQSLKHQVHKAKVLWKPVTMHKHGMRSLNI